MLPGTAANASRSRAASSSRLAGPDATGALLERRLHGKAVLDID